MHSTDDLDDSYLGSGHRLEPSVKKYGRCNHVRVIIEMCHNRQALIDREAELVTESMLCDPMCLNLCVGGSNPKWMNTPRVNIKKQRRIDLSHPNAAPKVCGYCGCSYSPRLPLTYSRLRGHIKKAYCSRVCATTVRNIALRGTSRTQNVRQQISQTLTGLKRPADPTKRINPNHPDAASKLCEWCQNTYSPKQPLTPSHIKAHKRKRVCSRRCALMQHNDNQSITRSTS